MARLNKKYAALHTQELRNKVWARVVKQELLPDSDPCRPYAHLICDALNQRRVEEGKASLGPFFTPTRWLDWWSGAHPTSGKYLSIASVVKGSEIWFEPHVAEAGEHPLHTLLHAMDLLANPVNEFDIYEILLALQKKWGPRQRIHRRYIWLSPQFPDAEMANEIATEHYSYLAPASIIRHMLWVGEAMRVGQLPQHKEWMFDLVSAALSVFALYNVNGLNSMIFSGTDGDIAAFMFRIFTRRYGDISNASGREDVSNILKASLKKENKNGCVLPDSEYMVEMLVNSILLFDNELKKYGISMEDVDCFDQGRFFPNCWSL